MKEQKTTKWSNFNPLCLARHVLRNLWMTVLAGLICVMAVYLLQTLVSKPSYDSQVTFAVTSRSASATASGSIAVTDSVASQFGELLQSNPVRTAAAAEMGLNAFPGTCSVDVPENTNILILTVTAPTPELAFRGALAVMDCYEAYADFILASAVLNPINGPTLPSQPSAQASRDRLLRLAGPIGALAMIAVLLLLAVSQETVQTVPGARDQLDTKLLATLRHERKRGALLRNKNPLCSSRTRPAASITPKRSISSARRWSGHMKRMAGRSSSSRAAQRTRANPPLQPILPCHWRRSISVCCCWTPTCASLRSR